MRNCSSVSKLERMLYPIISSLFCLRTSAQVQSADVKRRPMSGIAYILYDTNATEQYSVEAEENGIANTLRKFCFGAAA